MTFKPSGTGASATDAVRCTVAHFEIVYTDVTGLGVGGMNPASGIQPIPATQQPDGIACDGLTNVADGAKVLMRAIGSPILQQFLTAKSISLSHGYITAKQFAPIPSLSVDPSMGLCINVSAQDGAILSAGNNGIAVVGGNCQGHVVLDATLYRPPVEFHIDSNGQTITDTNPSRQLALAVQLTGPTIPTLGYTGAKPNAYSSCVRRSFSFMALIATQRSGEWLVGAAREGASLVSAQ